ncbi:MAG: DUF1178 family protein [Sphingomonadaceae bacterium]
MIVFDLKCSTDHVFEAWFANSESFEDQRMRGFLCCPLCGDVTIEKAVMAPRVGQKGNQRAGEVTKAAVPEPSAHDVKAMLGMIAKAQAAALTPSTWVGGDFVTQARAMDVGDLPVAAIHGQATSEQARDLIEDGIAVMPLLVPFIPPDQRN